MLTCTKCNGGELRVLRSSSVIRSLFEVECLNAGCKKTYSIRLGLAGAVSEVLEEEFSKRISKGRSIERN